MADKPQRRSTKSLQRLKRLVSLMNDNSLIELELEEENFRVRLVKESQQTLVAPAPRQQAAPPPGTPATQNADTPPAPVEGDKATGNQVEIKSPIVGTFYRSPAPDADAFVEVGSKVEKDSVVCIIEAMKVMNEIKAECRGTISKILVENAETVEYGQVLFIVDPD
ncbi:MAG: acetyl-CoA carboxylase biotin carboxyl carrier protein [Planctomycetota bacterium]|nr:acetyl-CoA carboxylase biotin carboxyl carrier protein [Planctomycetota bacterium]